MDFRDFLHFDELVIGVSDGEMGEARTLPETRYIVKWLSDYLVPQSTDLR
jgi:hypothetical protein